MRESRVLIGLLPGALAIGAFLLLAAPGIRAEQQQVPITTSACQVEMQKLVTPERLVLGDVAEVKLVMEHDCPANKEPVDLVFLVDVSNSMTRGRNTIRTGADEPDPGDPSNEPVPPSKPDPGDPDPPAPPVPPEPGPEPPAPFASAALDGIVPGLPQQDPEPPDPGEPPVKPPPAPIEPPEPGDPGSNVDRPGTGEPAGCERERDNTEPRVPPGNVPVDPRNPREPTRAPGDPAPTRTPGSSEPGGDRRDTNDEPAGTDDLVREAQQFIRDFVEQPEVKRDLADGTLRLGMVAFNDRGRRLVSLTTDGKRLATRTNLLRGGGKTRVDIGARIAERVLIDPNANRREREEDAKRKKVLVIISDGAFCTREARVRINNDIHIVTMLAGRSPWEKRLRDVATDTAFALRMRPRGTEDLMRLYDKEFIEYRPMTMDTLQIRDELADNVRYVPDSASPPPDGMDGSTLIWDYAPPGQVVSMTYRIEPLEIGLLDISVNAVADWTDSEEDTGLEFFPAAYLEVFGDAVPTNTPEPTPTPRFAP